MSTTKKVFSSGGVGDTLIVGMKIQQDSLKFPATEYVWKHFEKHECHSEPCLDIMDQFVEGAEFCITDKSEACAKQLAVDTGGHYIDTVITGWPNPYLKQPLCDGKFVLEHSELFDLSGHIVVQVQAGRMYDNTRREIGPGVITELLETFERKIVIIGPEHYNYSFADSDRVINLAGTTDSILDCLQLINDCILFVGQDGVVAYYAMMLKKLTIVNFHIPTLINHYWNAAWQNHSLAFTGAGRNLNKLPEHEKLKLLFNVIKERA